MITASSAEDFGEDVVLYMEQYRPCFWQVLIMAFLPLFWNYHVKITENEISFGYSCKITSKRANRIAIVKEAESLFDKKWGGWGIHYRPAGIKNIFRRWERFYIGKNGGAVKVTLDEAGKGDTTTFFFSSENPQTVCYILNKKI